jgi:hypothetical protein
MKIINILTAILLLGLSSLASAQPTFNRKDHKEEAFLAIKEMKYGGILVVRLKTNHVKIKALEKDLQRSNLKNSQRKRVQSILDETITKRDAINKTMAYAFLDSFTFCPVYLCYDSSANTLKYGAKNGIFLNRNFEIDPSISIPDTAHVFVAYYHEKSGEYPSDGLMLRRLNGVLSEPFPNFTAIKESFVNDVNTPRLRKIIVVLNRRLEGLLARAEKRG